MRQPWALALRTTSSRRLTAMTVADAEGATDRDLRIVQVEQCYRQLPIALTVNLVNGLILSLVLWEPAGPITILLWLLMLAGVSLFRHRSGQAFRTAPKDERFSPERWQHRFTAGACAAGVTWGLAGLLLYPPESIHHQVFLAFMIGGMIAGAIPLLSLADRAYSLFAIPAALPIGLRMVTAGDPIHLLMGLMIVIFTLAMLATSIQVHRIHRDAERLRHDLSTSIETSHALEKLVRLDPLTGIPNRRLFEEEIWKEWRRAVRDHDTVALVSADLDHFKEYNDHYGHPAGDRCLVQVAQAMQRALARPRDVVARIGGEEFAILLPGTTLAGARSVAEQIRRAILDLNLPHEVSPVGRQVSASFGVASTEDPAILSPAHLIRASDAALYEAKRLGRNRVEASEPAARTHGAKAAHDAGSHP